MALFSYTPLLGLIIPCIQLNFNDFKCTVALSIYFGLFLKRILKKVVVYRGSFILLHQGNLLWQKLVAERDQVGGTPLPKVHIHEIYKAKCSCASMKCRYFCTHTFLAFKNVAGRLPALNQTSNTCKVAADSGFQQLFNFNFTFKVPAGSLSSLTAQMLQRHFPFTLDHTCWHLCALTNQLMDFFSLPFFFHLH